MAQDLRGSLAGLVSDAGVTAIREVTTFAAGDLVSPPAGYYKADEVGLARAVDGTCTAIVDAAASQANRVEAALKAVAPQLGLPVLRVVDEAGGHIPQIAGRDTSLDWPHRHADAHWRLLEAAAVDQGVLSAKEAAAIRAATIYDAEPLLRRFPQSLLLGWWSNPGDTDKIAAAKGKDAKATAEVVAQLVADIRKASPAPYSGVASLARASRVLTSTIIATDVVPVPRMGSRLDPFGPLPGAESKEDKAPLAMAGLGTIPPSAASDPLLHVRGEIVGRSFVSLPLIRRYEGFADTELAHTLLLALALLGVRLLRSTESGLHLRSFSDLAPLSTTFEIYDQDGAHEWALDASTDELLDLVAELGRDVGWDGEKVVTATPTYLKLAGIAAAHRAEK